MVTYFLKYLPLAAPGMSINFMGLCIYPNNRHNQGMGQ
jgi:hypothetical protein